MFLFIFSINILEKVSDNKYRVNIDGTYVIAIYDIDYILFDFFYLKEVNEYILQVILFSRDIVENFLDIRDIFWRIVPKMSIEEKLHEEILDFAILESV